MKNPAFGVHSPAKEDIGLDPRWIKAGIIAVIIIAIYFAVQMISATTKATFDTGGAVIGKITAAQQLKQDIQKAIVSAEMKSDNELLKMQKEGYDHLKTLSPEFVYYDNEPELLKKLQTWTPQNPAGKDLGLSMPYKGESAEYLRHPGKKLILLQNLSVPDWASQKRGDHLEKKVVYFMIEKDGQWKALFYSDSYKSLMPI